ncbi:MAG: FtsX-like permease family protein [Planctomycetota bacterium]|nr:FtsX-like permease family protein [Planctomycetota bacterium]
MNAARLAARGLGHFWRTNLGVVAGCAVATAVLTGALAVGDSVRAALREQALARVGGIDAALDARDRLFTDALAGELAAELGSIERTVAADSTPSPREPSPEAGPTPVRVRAALALSGVASVPGTARRANGVRAVGVDAGFFDLAPKPGAVEPPAPGEVLVSERLARQLGVTAADEVLLRVDLPSAMARDMVLAQSDERTIGLRVKVAGVLGDEAGGRFSLSASPLPPLLAVCSRAWLQEELELGERSNLLLVGGAGTAGAVAAAAEGALARVWTLADAGWHLRPTAVGEGVELTGERVFLDAALGEALADAPLPAVGVLTTFAKRMGVGERATPYSMVSAVGPLNAAAAGTDTGLVPADLAADEIVIHSWLAEDLEARPGDELSMTTYALGGSSRLVERGHRFEIRAVVPLAGAVADPSLMPAFPGLADADHCRDWEPGIELDLDVVRDEDEAYWDEHRGTPKAFVGLAAGQALWADRFGSLTAVRFPGAEPEAIARLVRERVDPASIGLFFEDVRTPALATGAATTDFAGLFGGLSSFLIAAALLLSGMLFAFGVEQRSRELGLLSAVGWRRRRVARAFLTEGGVLALAGAALGVPAGVAYTAALLHGLATVWSGAVGGAAIGLTVAPTTLVGGGAASVALAVAVMAWSVRRLGRRPAAELLAGAPDARRGPALLRARRGPWIAAGCVLGATALLFAADPREGAAAAGAFFGAGALLLVAGVAASGAFLAWLAAPRSAPRDSLAALALGGAARRGGRSLGTVALLAAGTFLVVAVAANHRDAASEATGAGARRDTGTGGFALVAEATLGVLHDVNTAEGREAYGLDPAVLEGVMAVPLRVRDGDEASCLHLGVPATPRLLGVEPGLLDARGAFRFTQAVEGVDLDHGWRALATLGADGSVPAVGDEASITWSMHKRVGDTVEVTGEDGRPVRVRIVAAVAGSILQGNLLIAESAFEERFPSVSGHRMFLVDAPAERVEVIAEELGRGLEDEGLAVTPAAVRLAEFHAVQNTYLAIFGVLGAIGMLLGTVGLGLVVLRNALERRSELALMRAVGFRGGALRRMIAGEHGLLLVLGLGAGAEAGLVALLPAVAGEGAGWGRAAGLVVALALSGGLWVVLAARLALRGEVLATLRRE